MRRGEPSEDGEEIPILAGAKLTGRASGYNVGLVDVQTELAHEAVASWIRVMKSIPQFGLKFTKSHELDALGRKLKYLKRFAQTLGR